MKSIERYQIRGVPGFVQALNFDGRRVDYWAPAAQTQHLLIAHDGQNVFDPRTATMRMTWNMAQSAIHVSKKLGIVPPAIIAIFHSRTEENPWGRIKDLTPEDPYRSGVKVVGPVDPSLAKEQLGGNEYLGQITDGIVPSICDQLHLSINNLDKAIIGSSMGGLASLYAMGKRADFFTTALALSTHWPIGEKPLVDALINALPSPGQHKVWMSHGDKGLDAQYAPLQKYADAKMIEKGWRLHHDFMTKSFKRSGHSERSWAKYLDQPIHFWLQA